MATNAIRAVFFDAVGTLIHPEPSAITVYAAVGRRFGSHYDVAAIKQRFLTAFGRQEGLDRAQGNRTNPEREVRRWRSIVAEVFDDVTEPEACFQNLFQHFALPQSWRCEEDATAVLGELSERGYEIGLASNFDERLHHVIAGLPELRCIRHCVISAEIGFRKPEARFFQQVCAAVNQSAERVLFIGDDPINDYVGARAAGLPAFLFDPLHIRLNDTPLRMGNLIELLTLLPISLRQSPPR